MSQSLCQQFSIDEQNLERRRALIGITDADRRLMVKMIPWARKVAPQIARAFYDHQFARMETSAFLRRRAEARGIDLGTFRDHLEDTQSNYLLEVFTGAQDNWDCAYFERRLRVGKVHDDIDLPFKHYLGAYPMYFHLVRKHLRRSHPLRPGLVRRVEEAVLKVFNLDQQAIGDAFLLSVIRSIHFDIHSVDLPPGADRTEVMGQVKRQIAGATERLGEHLTSVATAATDLRSMNSSMAMARRRCRRPGSSPSGRARWRPRSPRSPAAPPALRRWPRTGRARRTGCARRRPSSAGRATRSARW
ncbi:MAG: protoglobin domain-containing protein [Myxococcota bacterium]